MEAVLCAPVLHPTATPEEGHPLVKVNVPYLGLEDEMVEEVSSYCGLGLLVGEGAGAKLWGGQETSQVN